MRDNIIKVVKIQDIFTKGKRYLKLVTFKEFKINGVKVQSAKFGERLFFGELKNIVEQDLGKNNVKTWEGDPLFKKVKDNSLVNGKILTFKTIDGSEFHCAVFGNEPNEIKAAAKQLFFRGKGSTLINKNGLTYEYIPPEKISKDAGIQNAENIETANSGYLGFKIDIETLLNQPRFDYMKEIRSLEEAHAKAFIAKGKENEKRLYEESLRKEYSPWAFKNLITWISIILILCFFAWMCSLEKQ